LNGWRRFVIRAMNTTTHYYLKLNPPRASCPFDITDSEKALMARPAVYFQKLLEAGKVLLYGPVTTPGGAFGLGLLEVQDEAEARQLGEEDPSVPGGLNRFEIYPVQVAAVRAIGTIGLS
jgi:uncharacterized protein